MPIPALIAVLSLLPAQGTLRTADPSPTGLVERAPTATLPALIGEYQADRGALGRMWGVPMSTEGRDRQRALGEFWLERLDALPFEELGVGERVDWLLLHAEVEGDLRGLAEDAAREEAVRPLLPHADAIAARTAGRARWEPLPAREAAAALDGIAQDVETTLAALDAGSVTSTPELLGRAAGLNRQLRRALADWHGFRADYDPLFTWWTAQPWQRAETALGRYSDALRKAAGTDDPDKLLGDAIGAAALAAAMRQEFLAYSPEELLQIAEQEYAWCETEMLRAARELGYGDDWKAALDHAEPGAQPELIRTLAEEAVDFLEARALVTIPELCKQSWRMDMMSVERQRVTPYFTGGETISIAFPTDAMSHADKLMSMRGNNEHFARATVHHELIPGHHLQQYMTARHATWRRPFGTPFWGEGWALYWELRLWDLDFARGPEDRIGMLFWRMHRCARILFSLNFHLGAWDANQCVDFLVERVGHERRNATAEVRRSINGSYPPLYQAAYMTGGLQLYALHRELVGAGRMSERAFHDAVLREGSIPIEMLRALLIGEALERDFEPRWRFHDDR